jgi:hypothetical protein
MAGDPDPTRISRARLQAELAEGPGYVVLRGLLDTSLTDGALRRLNLEILRCGISAEQIDEWKYATYWPSIRWDPEILALRGPLQAVAPADDGEEWGDAQLLLRFPDEADDWPLTPHVDDLPEWAEAREYEMIFGVALSRASERDGCLTVWTGSHRGEDGERHLVELEPGDVVVLHPRVGHSSTLNRGGTIRYAVYFRLLGAPA